MGSIRSVKDSLHWPAGSAAPLSTLPTLPMVIDQVLCKLIDSKSCFQKGGYVFFETSSLSVQQLPGIQSKAWLKTPVYQPTGPNGLCLKFSVNSNPLTSSKHQFLNNSLPF